MSIHQMNKVWRHSKSKGSALIVMLAIADFANDDGISFPSMPTIARKARLTIRHAQRTIRELVEAGELAITEGAGPGGSHLYRVTSCHGVTSCQGGDGVKDTGGVTSAPLGDDAHARGGMTPASPNPSEEREEGREPSTEKIQTGGGDMVVIPLGRDLSLDVMPRVEEITQRWNAIAGVLPVLEITGPFRDRLRARLREHRTLTWWEDLFARIARSDFLCGRKTDFAASLEWALGPKNLAKILAGNYENKSTSFVSRQGPGIEKFLKRGAAERGTA